LTRLLRLGTRGSQLARWQARAAAARLESLGHAVELVVVSTVGDRLQQAPLSEAGGKRLFVKDLEDALLRGEIDLAVHSAKDLPSAIPNGLAIAAALPREDPRDAIVTSFGHAGDVSGVLAAVAAVEGRRIGTSSVRRIAQLSPRLPGAIFAPVRGNVDTRLRKLDSGEYDALVLACAGLRRLNLEARITSPLPVSVCVPAPGQGIIVIETRADDREVRAVLRKVHDEASGVALEAERSVVEALGGDCQIPLGALARLNGAGLEMDAIVCSLDGQRVVRRHTRGSIGQPASLGRRLADELVVAGAADILAEARGRTHSRTEHTEGP
jgi:hydroxymethylbilane synthase